MERQGAWVDVYPIGGRKVSISTTSIVDGDWTDKIRLSLGRELSGHVEELWGKPRENGWKSSWIPLTQRIEWGSGGKTFLVRAGAMQYHQSVGIADAIRKGKKFAPKQRFSPAISVGFLTATKDSKVVFQRRPLDVQNCPGTLINEPTGYMAARNFVPDSQSEGQQWANDPRLFDVYVHLEAKRAELANTLGVSPMDVNYNPSQDILGAGWRTNEMYFSTTGTISSTEDELRENIRKKVDGLRKAGKTKDADIIEGTEFRFVPFESLRRLIGNQGRLSQIEDPAKYIPKDDTDFPMLDESLSGLVWGYKGLTGERLDINETVERLSHDGLPIRVYNTISAGRCEFPTIL